MQTKICKTCSVIFSKPTKTSAKQWEGRFCCSVSCAAKYRGCQWLDKFKLKKGSQLGKKTQFKKGQLSGINNPNWKGKDVGYGALHQWVIYNFGQPRFCEQCKCSNRQMYHWANLSGEYKRDRDDWKRMCVPCHKNFDLGNSATI